MSDSNDDNRLNEFEYTEQEKAELAKLDELNEDNDELQDKDEHELELHDDPDLEVGDDLVDDLLGKEEGKDPEQPSADGQDNADDKGQDSQEPPPEPDPTPEPEPDYTAQLEEMEQRVQEAQGNIDDTVNKLRDLAEKYDDGEIAQGKYDVEKMNLERLLRRQEQALFKIEQAQEDLQSEAQTKIETYQEGARQAWQNDLMTFLNHPSNSLIMNNRHIAEQFDQIMQQMGQAGVFNGLNNMQILNSVRNQLSFHIPQLSETPYTPEQPKQAKQKPPKPTHDNVQVPTSLSQMQAQELPQDDPYAYIRKLSGVAYEKALSKLSEAEYDKFLYG